MTRRRHDHYNAEAEVAAPSVVDVVVRVPRGWAVWLGEVAAPVAAFIAVVVCIKQGTPWREAIVIVPLVGLGAGFGTCFLVSLALAWDEVCAHREARKPPQQRRLEADGAPPTPGRPVVPVRLALTDGKHQTRHLDVDITPELQVFAQRVLAWRENALAPLGLSFAEAPAGKVGFDGFLALRDEMMARGLLRWKNAEHHLSGYVFRAGFDEALDYIARYPLPGAT